jgi:hypothetical protein
VLAVNSMGFDSPSSHGKYLSFTALTFSIGHRRNVTLHWGWHEGGELLRGGLASASGL